MATLNPEIKLQSNYKEILWGHIYQIGNYDLDVDCPYAIPKPEEKAKKPSQIGYPTTNIRFRFYGRNLQMMVDKVSEMEDPEIRQEMVNLIASFMFNSCKIWNNENLSNEVIAEHLKILSKGQLQIQGSEITVSADASSNLQPKKFFKSNASNFGRNKNGNNNNKKNQNRGKNFRRY
jgi:NDP-sugar pyrophosphorylase family protein